MSPPWFFNNLALPADSVILGSLIPNIRNPHQDAQTDSVTLGSLISNIRNPHQDAQANDRQEYEIVTRSASDFAGKASDSKDSLFVFKLAKWASARRSDLSKDRLGLAANTTKVYELKNPNDVFNSLCELKGVRTWLQRRVEKSQNSYFIVGLQTFSDAAVKQSIDDKTETSVSAELPVDAATTALAGLNFGLNPKLKAKQEASQSNNMKFKSPGEQILAVSYRRLKFSWFSPSADNVSLSDDNCWVMVSDDRGEEDEDEAEIVQVTLEDLNEEDSDVKVDGYSADDIFMTNDPEAAEK